MRRRTGSEGAWTQVSGSWGAQGKEETPGWGMEMEVVDLDIWEVAMLDHGLAVGSET